MGEPVATILRAVDVIACPLACGDLFASTDEARDHLPECPRALAALAPWGAGRSPFTTHRAHPVTEHRTGDR